MWLSGVSGHGAGFPVGQDYECALLQVGTRPDKTLDCCFISIDVASISNKAKTDNQLEAGAPWVSPGELGSLRRNQFWMVKTGEK